MKSAQVQLQIICFGINTLYILSLIIISLNDRLFCQPVNCFSFFSAFFSSCSRQFVQAKDTTITRSLFYPIFVFLFIFLFTVYLFRLRFLLRFFVSLFRIPLLLPPSFFYPPLLFFRLVFPLHFIPLLPSFSSSLFFTLSLFHHSLFHYFTIFL